MTVAAKVAVVASAGREENHGRYVDGDEESHRRETIATVAAAAAACHHRETSVAAAAATCHRREIPYRRPFVGLRLPRPPRPEDHGRRQEHGGSVVQLIAGELQLRLWVPCGHVG